MSCLSRHRYIAEHGDARAQKNLGQCYELGFGILENWLTAAHWYELSARQGYVKGEFALARAYQFAIGLPQSNASAKEWFAKAAQLGHPWAQKWVSYIQEDQNSAPGFYSDEESAKFAGWTSAPSGITFRNYQERFAWLNKTSVRSTYDRPYWAPCYISPTFIRICPY